MRTSYTGHSLTPRQTALVNRLLAGEEIMFHRLSMPNRSSALRLHAKGVLTFAPVTNKLELLPPEPPVAELHRFPDGSSAKRVGNGPWTVETWSHQGVVSLGCRAAEFAAAANAGLFRANRAATR